MTQMTPEQTIAIIGALTAMLGVLGKIAWSSAGKKSDDGDKAEKAPALMERDEMDRRLTEATGLTRSMHAEVRIELRDLREKLIQMDAKLDALLRRKE